MTGLARRTGRSIRLVRTSLEVTVVVLGFALGGIVGRRHRALRAAHRPGRAALPADADRARRPPGAKGHDRGRRRRRGAPGPSPKPSPPRARADEPRRAGLSRRRRARRAARPGRRPGVAPGPATVRVHRDDTRSSTSSTGPSTPARRGREVGPDDEALPHPGEPEGAVAARLTRGPAVREVERPEQRQPAHLGEARGERADQRRARPRRHGHDADGTLRPAPLGEHRARRPRSRSGSAGASSRSSSRSRWPQPEVGQPGQGPARQQRLVGGDLALDRARRAGPCRWATAPVGRGRPRPGPAARGRRRRPGRAPRWGTTGRRTRRSARTARRSRRRGTPGGRPSGRRRCARSRPSAAARPAGPRRPGA